MDKPRRLGEIIKELLPEILEKEDEKNLNEPTRKIEKVLDGQP